MVYGELFRAAGADFVVGGHPHVLQGMEYIDGKPVVYSMGDYWFNGETNYTTQYISDKQEQTDFYGFLEGLSPNAVIDENGVITEADK